MTDRGRQAPWWAWVLLGLLVGVPLGGLWTGTESSPPAAATVYERVAPGVVSVLAGEAGVGSGFAVAPDRVVTARHLVIEAETLRLRDLQGRELSAQVVGLDARTDLALLQVLDGELPPVELGEAAHLRVGDGVLVVGNPYGLGHTLATGVVGNLARSRVEGEARVDFLQLTVPLNPGNSGGPVFDGQGRVVGVLAGTHAHGQAIAFAVPVEALRAVLPDLERGQRLSRAFLGVRTEVAHDGLRVVAVVPGGPADRAGLRPGDVLRGVRGEPVASPEALERALDGLVAGSRTTVQAARGEEVLGVVVELADWAVQPMAVAGMTLRPLPGTGGEVVAVRPRSRAEQAGVRTGDVVRRVDGLPVQAPVDVQDALSAGGRQVEVLREGMAVVVALP